jgi:hypothetical protein
MIFFYKLIKKKDIKILIIYKFFFFFYVFVYHPHQILFRSKMS